MEMFESRHATRAKIGVFAIGLAAYWPQFEGLRDQLENYGKHVESQLGQGGDVVSAGMVDSVEKAREAGAFLAREQVDIVFVYAATYATSSQVLPVLQQANVPTILLNLQPTPALDYETITTGAWLANCSACCVPEIAMALTRARLPFKVVSGTLFEDAAAWTDIQQWCQAAKVVRHVKNARLGFLGHTYPGMLDMYSDFTAIQGQLGSHIEVLEIDDLVVRVRDASDDEIRTKIHEIESIFDFAEPSSDPIAAPIEREDLEWSARVAVGLDKLARDFNLDALAYYYRGLEGNENERVASGMIVGNTLLTAQGIPCSGEGDLKNAIAMLIMDQLGAGGSFTEFYAMDLVENFVLMGHDGPGHIAISNQRPVLRKLKLYHGKRGFGVSVEFKVKYGPVTILGVTQLADSTLKFLVAQGESIPGPTFRVGNTNSRIRFALDPATFITRWSEEGPTHHVALGVGDVKSQLEKVGYLSGIQTHQFI
jgi:L-arabinose isomerase